VFKALCEFLLETCEALLSSNFEHYLADAHVTIHELMAAGTEYVAVCCSMLQCVEVWCSALQYNAV